MPESSDPGKNPVRVPFNALIPQAAGPPIAITVELTSFTGKIADPPGTPPYKGINYNGACSVEVTGPAGRLGAVATQIPVSVFTRPDDLLQVVAKPLVPLTDAATKVYPNPMTLMVGTTSVKFTQILDGVIPDGMNAVGPAVFVQFSQRVKIQYTDPTTSTPKATLQPAANNYPVYIINTFIKK